jgi:hypothetical protein
MQALSKSEALLSEAADRFLERTDKRRLRLLLSSQILDDSLQIVQLKGSPRCANSDIMLGPKK